MSDTISNVDALKLQLQIVNLTLENSQLRFEQASKMREAILAEIAKAEAPAPTAPEPEKNAKK